MKIELAFIDQYLAYKPQTKLARYHSTIISAEKPVIGFSAVAHATKGALGNAPNYAYMSRICRSESPSAFFAHSDSDSNTDGHG